MAEAEAEAEPQLSNESDVDEQANYFPPELVGHFVNDSTTLYHLYLIELRRKFEYDIPVHDIVLAVRTELELDDENLTFDLEVDQGSLTVHMKYIGVVSLTSEEVPLCLRFQITLFSVLVNRNLKKLKGILDAFHLRSDLAVFDYLLLPSTGSCLHQNREIIDWNCVRSVLFSCENLCNNHTNDCLPKGHGRRLHTRNGSVCSCMLENSLVYTPHNGLVCITGILDNLDENSLLRQKDGKSIPYKQYYKQRGIDLGFGRESLLNGRPIFSVKNYLQKCRQPKEKEPSNTSVELPPELCSIIMSPISIATFHSFSFVPSIMHRIESLLIAANLKKMLIDHCMQKVVIPTMKVLEAITTKKCQEKFDLESLEILGDSFLKYATSQQLFKTYPNDGEGFLSAEREKIISNNALCKLGCDHKLPGFIRNDPFDPKMWIIPGDQSRNYSLDEELLSTTRKVYNRERRTVESKKVADVVEALIGAFISTGSRLAALSFMNWVGIKVDNILYKSHIPVPPDIHVDIKNLESLLKYSFHDHSLLEEALTHGSWKRPNYQRLEFLGDSVLDYLITMHLYRPGMKPELLTNLRSASVNNECYALSAVKAGLHEYILHKSQELKDLIAVAVLHVEQLRFVTTFGWEWEATYPKVLGDIIESVAGAIFIDSGYNEEIVFKKIGALLEPMITPETLKLHPVIELKELCENRPYKKKEHVVCRDDGMASVTVEVIDANGVKHERSCIEGNIDMAKKLASRAVLKSLKESMPST